MTQKLNRTKKFYADFAAGFCIFRIVFDFLYKFNGFWMAFFEHSYGFFRFFMCFYREDSIIAFIENFFPVGKIFLFPFFLFTLGSGTDLRLSFHSVLPNNSVSPP